MLLILLLIISYWTGYRDLPTGSVTIPIINEVVRIVLYIRIIIMIKLLLSMSTNGRAQ